MINSNRPTLKDEIVLKQRHHRTLPSPSVQIWIEFYDEATKANEAGNKPQIFMFHFDIHQRNIYSRVFLV